MAYIVPSFAGANLGLLTGEGRGTPTSLYFNKIAVKHCEIKEIFLGGRVEYQSNKVHTKAELHFPWSEMPPC